MIKFREPNTITIYGVDGTISTSDGTRIEDVGTYTRWPRNTCGFCGEIHPTNPEGWRDAHGYKIPCEECAKTRREG